MDNKENIDIHSYNDLNDQILCILYNSSGEHLKPKNIVSILINEYKISTRENAVRNALRTNCKLLKKSFVHKHKDGYEIMEKGKSNLKNTIFVLNPDEESKNTTTAKDVFGLLVGNIKICDPFFDNSAVDFLSKHIKPEKVTSIEIITLNKKADHDKLKLLETNKCKSIKQHKSKNQQHDRFILSNNKAFTIGCSLNGFGKKESYIIQIDNYRDFFLQIFEDKKGFMCFDKKSTVKSKNGSHILILPTNKPKTSFAVVVFLLSSSGLRTKIVFFRLLFPFSIISYPSLCLCTKDFFNSLQLVLNAFLTAFSLVDILYSFIKILTMFLGFKCSPEELYKMHNI